MLARAAVIPTGAVAHRAAPEITGTDMDGNVLRLSVRQTAGGARWTLLLFVKLDCVGCETLWPLVARGSLAVGSEEVAVVGMIAEVEPGTQADLLRRRGTGIVVVGRATWDAYGVLGPSFAVLVNGATGCVDWESVTWDGQQVVTDTARVIGGGSTGARGVRPGCSDRAHGGTRSSDTAP